MKNIKTITLIIGSIVIAVGLILFGRLYSEPSSQSAGVINSVQTASGGSNHQRLAPDFTLSRLDGGTITLSEFRGKKPVVLDFWASWCPNCRRDMPRLNRFYEKYKDEVEVIGINLQENEGVVRNFVQSNGISFPIAMDPRRVASRIFAVRYTNLHILIDKNGNIVREIPGDIRESDIKSLIQ